MPTDIIAGTVAPCLNDKTTQEGWRRIIADLAQEGVIRPDSTTPMGVTLHYIVRTLRKDPRCATFLSAAYLDFRDDPSPKHQLIGQSQFERHVRRYGQAMGFETSWTNTHELIRGLAYRDAPLEDAAIQREIAALAELAR
ncbi:hypothetical protein HYPGJ_31592 [Hyphomicrobium sp. GJ21]|uniref:hypothetical protein n=1 Tax=Hyphomicrobium sp. GJ21 TaxID=113574 RepID=UPI000622B8BC|nr:hypothetical protein [Hyphomicrobium sp. GJ21]CEJ88098.1 hypothetical protein HYPGJ_31592 [Hyphomicrobium sp. GJ21]